MDKIRIKGLVQGKKKLKDGGFAVGFRTKWGVVWIAPGSAPRFFCQNKHLSFLKMRREVDEAELIGRYIYVTKKKQESYRDGFIVISPRL